MMEIPSFELWLEFEHWEARPDDDPTCNFFNMTVTLSDGRCYGLNVWTFNVIQSIRYPWPYVEGQGEPEEYLLPPDLFVERLDRELMERVIRQMLANDEIKPEWLCPPEDDNEAET